MYRVLPIEWTGRQPSGPYGAGGGGQRRASKSHEAAGARSVPPEPDLDPGRVGYRGESAQGCSPNPVRRLATGVDAVVSGRAAECGCRADAPGGDSAAGRDLGSAGVLTKLVLAFIGFYRAALSPAIPSSCRFYPTCSTYAYEAVSAWGLRRGLRLALGRLGRCRPLGPYGYDPVPERPGAADGGRD